MDYDLARNQAVHDSYAKNVKDFLDHYRAGEPTVVMLPGGMGSQLDRSSEAYHGQAMSFLDYSPVWLSPGVIFRGDALTLEIEQNRHDIHDFIIVPDGPMRFLIRAYEGTSRFFFDKGANYIVYGYDWRRSLAEAAVNLQSFLTSLRRAVFNHHHEDIVPRTILLCHSQGGLVAKMFLDRVQNNLSSWLDKVVTVATPFYGTYGTANHMQRYFVGESLLNILHGAKRVAKIVGSLPGPYVLLPIDLPTWKRRQDALGLNDQPYPVEDENRNPVDPYDTANMGAGNRYPSWMIADYLDEARDIRGAIDLELGADAIKRIFHLRATSTNTPCRFRWRRLSADFDPDQGPCPLEPLPQEPGQARGDGTVPYWSARLVQAPQEQIYDIPTEAPHQELLENSRTLAAIWSIMTVGKKPDVDPDVEDVTYAGLDAASVNEVNAFLNDAATKKIGADDTRAKDPRIWRGVVRNLLR